jgi:hypothetical protein
MKGYIFTEFLEMVEDRYGFVLMDRIILNANLESDGVYTSVGSYPQKELIELMKQLSIEIKEDIKTIMMYTGERIYNTSLNTFNKKLLLLEMNFPFIERLKNYLTNECRSIFNNDEILNVKFTSEENSLIAHFEFKEVETSLLMEGIIKGCISVMGESVNINVKNSFLMDQASTHIIVQK